MNALSMARTGRRRAKKNNKRKKNEMQNDFFGDLDFQFDDYTWQPDSSLGIDGFMMETPNVFEQNFFEKKSTETAAVAFSPPPLLSAPPPPPPLTLHVAPPLVITKPISSTKPFSSSSAYSLPFSFGSSQQKQNSLPKKTASSQVAFVKPQDLCSTTTKQIARDVQLIAEENAKIRQLPQPQMHGVANVTRNEHERRFLADCDAVSIEKKVLTSAKRKVDERKTTVLLERDEIPTEPLRKRGRKPKGGVLKELLPFEPAQLLRTLHSTKKNIGEFEKNIPIELREDITLLETTINASASMLCDGKQHLVASQFCELVPQLQHVLMHQFVMLFFSQHSASRCSVGPDAFPTAATLLPFFSMIAGILATESTVTTLCAKSLALSDPVAYKQLSPSSRNGVCFQERLLWFISVLSKSNLHSFKPVAVLRVLSLARYSQQLFRFAFRSLKETDFLESLLILANEDNLNALVYFAFVCEETKKINIQKIANTLRKRNDQLSTLASILIGKVEPHLMRHLLVYFFRNDAASIENIRGGTTTNDSLLGIAELLIGSPEQHSRFIEALGNTCICQFLTQFAQKYDLNTSRDLFLRASQYPVVDFAIFYGDLMNLKTPNNAPTAYLLDKLHVQLPVPLKRNDSCIFFITSLPDGGVVDLLHMLTSPAQILTAKSSELAASDFQIYVSLFDNKEKEFAPPAWHSLSLVRCKSLDDIVFCEWNKTPINLSSASRFRYEKPPCVVQVSSVQLGSKYVGVQNADLLTNNLPTTQFVDIDFLKAIVSRAFEAPTNLTANDFVEQYCRERNNLLTRENC